MLVVASPHTHPVRPLYPQVLTQKPAERKAERSWDDNAVCVTFKQSARGDADATVKLNGVQAMVVPEPMVALARLGDELAETVRPVVSERARNRSLRALEAAGSEPGMGGWR